MSTAALGTGLRQLDPAAFHEEERQTVTEYAVVLAVLIIAFTGIVVGLQEQIAAFLETVGSAIADLLP